jgi:hypothetical protein
MNVDTQVTSTAPVGLSVYRRIDHFRRTVEALGRNTLAPASPLYIFSDAPAPGDEAPVQAVRDYARTITGFKSVEIIERQSNSRVLNNRGGIKQLLERYGRLIFLEEDVETAPGFLNFMNTALERYRDDTRILSVTGYCPPIGHGDKRPGDAFLLRRFSAWGFATWAGRFDPFSLAISPGEVRRLLLNPVRLRSFISNGEDMLGLLLSEAGGEIDALDVKIMYRQFLDDTYTVYPRVSLVQNTGHDGTGVHCVTSDRFQVETWSKTDDFDMPAHLAPDPVARKANYRFRKQSYRRRMKLFRRCLRFLFKA